MWIAEPYHKRKINGTEGGRERERMQRTWISYCWGLSSALLQCFRSNWRPNCASTDFTQARAPALNIKISNNNLKAIKLFVLFVLVSVLFIRKCHCARGKYKEGCVLLPYAFAECKHRIGHVSYWRLRKTRMTQCPLSVTLRRFSRGNRFTRIYLSIHHNRLLFRFKIGFG